MELSELVAGVMLAALILYAVSAGADFGGGLWDLLATGPRARDQRALIAHALAPVWEANHVWLILVIVLLFTAFPPAFAAASVLLHIPLTLMLVGIVFRGSAFVFRKYDAQPDTTRWGRVFAVSSLVSPFFLGVSLGAITSGRLPLKAPPTMDFTARFVTPWLHAFPLLVGVFALCLFAFLAAVYLAVEAQDPALQNDFRTRALVSGAVSVVAGLATAWGATLPELAHVRGQLSTVPALWLVIGLGGVAWLAVFFALSARRFALARAFAVVLVALILCGWAMAQFPYLISPSLTLHAAAAPEATLRPLLVTLAIGAVVLFPSMFWLFRVFKRRPAFAALDDEN